MAQTGEIVIKASSNLTGNTDLQTVIASLPFEHTMALANGTGLGQANQVWTDERTVNSGANEDLDLSGGLTNALGVALTLTKLKAIVIVGLSTNTGDLTVSRPAANGVPLLAAASDAFGPLAPNGFIAYGNPSAAGITVTAATGDLINIANATGSAQKYRVIIFGTM